MPTDDERCREWARLDRIDAAFKAGDLAALRAEIDDPSIIPNGSPHVTTGTCLVYATYWSPRPFIRELLELGADPSAPADDGFPPLIATLSHTNDVPGSPRRPDVNDILRLLLRYQADPDQRGINDWTPLHMAVAQRNALAVQLLLDAGANPDLRTRIDDCDTPLEMARAIDDPVIVGILERRGAALSQRIRSGLTLLLDIPGTGELVQRQRTYTMHLRLWLQRGDPVIWDQTWSEGPGRPRVEDEGELLITQARINRGALMQGLFYGVEGMRIGGTRRVQIAPHLGFGGRGLGSRVPPNAVLTAEVSIV
jgi:hypothetical protein